MNCGLLVWVTMVAASIVGAETPMIEKTDLFESGVNGIRLYRIPGIVVTAKGTVLVYCEARRNTSGDWGEIEIHYRRGPDGGRSWEPARQIAHFGPRLTRNPAALAQKLGKPDDQSVNIPVAIADRNGSIHFFYLVEYARCFYMRSDDDGKTFSAPVDITHVFEEFRSEYDWKVLAVGPGHGIQLKNDRLILPIWLSPGTGVGAHRPSVVAVLYSDDHGATWLRGKIAAPDTEEFIYPNEIAAVELANGSVLFNMRSESKANRRLIATSPNGVDQWSTPRFDTNLWEPICMGSLIRIPAQDPAQPGKLIFSNPRTLARNESGLEQPGRSGPRRNLSIQHSNDNGASWPICKTLEPEGSAYSDLALLPDGSILCFYERGPAYGPSPHKLNPLTLARFNLSWLEAPNQ